MKGNQKHIAPSVCDNNVFDNRTDAINMHCIFLTISCSSSFVNFVDRVCLALRLNRFRSFCFFCMFSKSFFATCIIKTKTKMHNVQHSNSQKQTPNHETQFVCIIIATAKIKAIMLRLHIYIYIYNCCAICLFFVIVPATFIVHHQHFTQSSSYLSHMLCVCITFVFYLIICFG